MTSRGIHGIRSQSGLQKEVQTEELQHLQLDMWEYLRPFKSGVYCTDALQRSGVANSESSGKQAQCCPAKKLTLGTVFAGL